MIRREEVARPSRIRLAILALALACSGCGGSGGGGSTSNPTSPTSTPSIDTSSMRLVDGAGNPGPVTFRWLELTRESSGTVPVGSPGNYAYLYSFKIEVCMDAVPNPTNSPYLSEMTLLFVGSDDGNVPTTSGYYATSDKAPYGVRNGNCVVIKRIPTSRGGIDGEQFIGIPPSARYVLVGATFTPPTFPPITPPSQEWGTSCPSFEEIARANRRPPCVLRFATPLP